MGARACIGLRLMEPHCCIWRSILTTRQSSGCSWLKERMLTHARAWMQKVLAAIHRFTMRWSATADARAQWHRSYWNEAPPGRLVPHCGSFWIGVKPRAGMRRAMSLRRNGLGPFRTRVGSMGRHSDLSKEVLEQSRVERVTFWRLPFPRVNEPENQSNSRLQLDRADVRDDDYPHP